MDDELYNPFNMAIVAGGSIVVPHLRHAIESLGMTRAE
jgi:hypothetical protein